MSNRNNKRNKKLSCKILIEFILLFLILFILNACEPKVNDFKKVTRFYLNTYVTITVPKNTEDDIIEKAYEIIEDLEELLKKNRGQSFVDKKLISLLKISFLVSRLTSGRYDPTIYPIIELWGLYDDKWRVPNINEINDALQLVGYEKVNIDGNSIILSDGMGLDFGALGKGWIVDEVAEFLKRSGINPGMVDAGGDIKVWGDHIWKIGLKDPGKKGLIAIISLKNKAIATSGDYENNFIKDDKFYHHIFDPFTGFPSKSDLKSVTIITQECAQADGLATGLFVLGSKGIDKMKQAKIEYILIKEDGRIFSSGINVEWIDDEQE